jgi:hypothetical protein
MGRGMGDLLGRLGLVLVRERDDPPAVGDLRRVERVAAGSVATYVLAAAGAFSVSVPLDEPASARFPSANVLTAENVLAAPSSVMVPDASGTVSVRVLPVVIPLH